MAEFEKYEKKRQLGTNQFGTVHEAFDFGLSRSVAILEFHARYRQDPETWRELWREVIDRSQIEHPNLLSPLTSVESEGQVILPFMRQNFARRLAESPVPYDSVRTALKGALQGLACLHKHGKLHGYLTPANLLYGSEDLTQAVRISFSPGLYLGGVVPIKGRDQKSLAPEMFNEQLFGKIGQTVDLYCLGFAAYEMLRGAAFSELIPGSEINKNAFEAFHASPEMVLPSLKTVDPKAPADLVRVIDRLIQKRVADRYPQAEDALLDLDHKAKDSFEPVMAQVPEAKSGAAAARTAVTSEVSPPAGRTAPPARSVSTIAPGSSARPENASGKTPSPAVVWAKRLWEKHWTLLTAAAGMISVFTVLSIASLFTAGDDVTVSIVSEPEGATFTIDQVPVKEKTPTKVAMKPGAHEFTWTRDGFQSGKQTFDVKAATETAGKPESTSGQTIFLTLTAATVTVPLVVSPGDATIQVDGTARPVVDSGKYQLDLSPGSHTLSVALNEYVTETLTFDTAKTKQLEVTLSRKSAPPDLPGRSVPPVPKASRRLPEGLIAVADSPVHETLGLPWRVTVAALKDQLPAGEVPLELVLVEPGEFTFGITDPLDGELPRQTVRQSDPYYLAVTETTAAQLAAWKKAVTTDSNSDDPAAPPPSTNLPAVMVSFSDAQSFCRWVAPGSGRLPTEREWELAGRGTDGRLYPWGKNAPSEGQCRFAAASDGGKDQVAGPVGVRELPSGAALTGPGGIEIFHLLGNVAEWCEDLYVPGANEPDDAPGAGTNHVIRGASFLEPVSERTRLTWRANADAAGARDVGFRVAVPVPAEQGTATTGDPGSEPAASPKKPSAKSDTP